MKNTLVVFVILVMSLSCNLGGGWRTIEIDEDSTIVDVRTAEEYEAGHLRNAINIPHTEIRARIADHVSSKEDKITVYCRSGRRSRIAKKTLEDMGYKHVVNAGAFANLKKQQNKGEH